MINKRTIFISPLDWGMGHASRCVPIIRDLKQNNTILIGVTEINAFFFDRYFPDLQKIRVPSYAISYSKILPVWLKLILQWPKIRNKIRLENEQLKNIINEYKINLIISDNRFGMYSKKVESIFITHQLKIKVPLFSSLANFVNKKYIQQFNEVWVPDFENRKSCLAGQLSDSGEIKVPVKYIGPQSALTLSSQNSSIKKIDYLILLSGIEPQRTLLEREVLNVFKSSKKEIVLVRGSKNKIEFKNKNIQILDFVYGEELKNIIVNAETVICRSGYSTLMDLYLLNKQKIVLIPTPGQSEQIYLADFWKINYGAKVSTILGLEHSLKRQ